MTACLNSTELRRGLRRLVATWRRPSTESAPLTVLRCNSTSAGSASTAASTIDAYAATSQFVTDLNAAGVEVTSVTVLSTTATDEGGDDSTITIAIIAAVVSVGVVGISVGVYCHLSSPTDDFAKMEDSDAASGPASAAPGPGQSV